MNYYSIFTIITIETCDDILELFNQYSTSGFIRSYVERNKI